MQFQEFFRKNQYWSFISPLILIFGILIGFQLFFSRQNNEKNIISRFQSTLIKKEKIIDNGLIFLKKNFSSRDEGKIMKEIEERYKNEGISFFVFENDSLVYWSSNTIPEVERIPERIQNDASFVQKLENGWYLIKRVELTSQTIIGILLIQNLYPFNNEYLQNIFQEDFSLPEGSEVVKSGNENIIFSSSGKPLFSIRLTDKLHLKGESVLLYFTLYLAGFVILIAFLSRLLHQSELLRRNKLLFLAIFIVEILVVRLALHYFRFPEIIYNTELFSPEQFASSRLFPSLGDFILNSLVCLIVAFSFYKNYPDVILKTRRNALTLIVFSLFHAVLFSGSLLFTCFMMKDLILNSSFSMDLQNISGFTLFSVLGLIISATILLSFFLLVFRIAEATMMIYQKERSKKEERWKFRNSLPGIALYIGISSVLATIILNFYNDQAERGKRSLLALKLGVERDPIAEMMFSAKEQEIINDSVFFIEMPKDNGKSALFEDGLIRVIKQNCFQSTWTNYNVQVTLCFGRKILRIQPHNILFDCDQYFQNMLKNQGKATGSPFLYFLDFGFGYKNYLAVIPLREKKNPNSTLGMAYVEISSKLIFKDQGYPGLLIDNKKGQINDLSSYSYAFYRDKKLTQRYGDYDYRLVFSPPNKQIFDNPNYYSEGQYSHYFYPISADDFLIISREEPSIMDKISPFSYLFLFFSIYLMLFFAVIKFKELSTISFSRLGDRIQVVMTGIIFISLFIVGLVVVLYIRQLNIRKNNESLTEKAYSVLVEVQHKYGSLDDFNNIKDKIQDEQLTKFSNVFFTDINLFNTKGRLIASSRRDVFETGLISKMMNREAFEQLHTTHRSFYSQVEKIGKHYYNSVYIPFYNDQGELLAFINLPSFARQEELRREISSFLVNFINPYAFIIILGIMVSLIISSLITRPLKILTSKIGHLSFGKKNEKIVWRRKDEIGRLIDEYNRMIEEIEKSADLLIRSEREGAWREMARQVAHEIKNPLTPMKLSVQHLEKVWEERAPDWEVRLKRFSQTMTDQIESLSSIAAEFETFAKMPPPKTEILDVQEILQNVQVLYITFPSISYEFPAGLKNRFVSADKKQLFRVFTNLINNAIQAVENCDNGMIIIRMEDDPSGVIVSISDNGTGIPDDQKERVFLPNFTTKSTGMGLGLAIVKKIIEEVGGKITLKSEKEKGTSFYLWFPAVETKGKTGKSTDSPKSNK